MSRGESLPCNACIGERMNEINFEIIKFQKKKKKRDRERERRESTEKA